MNIPTRVDQTIRMPRKMNNCQFLCIHILKHVNNSNNNSDKFLVIINGRLKQIFPLNDKWDNSNEPDEEKELSFEVTGNWEIWELFDWSLGETIEN